ncbi:NADPH-dependent FMN reductase [Roseovarius sp. 2305UL8-3]|uniref:NADPH-dependent FMN reductase n=1 Tax=Roseovarius conchicola TaxID=3121636 RepID=UPI0035285C18
MSTPTLLSISGSLRKGSYNRMLLAEAVQAFGPAKVLQADLALPLYDGDLEEASGIPRAVQLLADQITQADAIVIASPEYNKGMSGVLKNATDWISRVPGGVLAGKPIAIVAAAAGRTGGETARFMVMSNLLQLQARIVPGPAVLIAGAMNAFDENGALKDEGSVKMLNAQMSNLRAAIA